MAGQSNRNGTQKNDAPTVSIFNDLHLFSAYSAQKSHVKPQTTSNHTKQARYSWHLSYLQLSTIEIGRKEGG
jgi:hypothetical protein